MGVAVELVMAKTLKPQTVCWMVRQRMNVKIGQFKTVARILQRLVMLIMNVIAILVKRQHQMEEAVDAVLFACLMAKP